MTTTPYVIVCALDLSDDSTAIAARAFDEAKRHEGAILHFLTLVEPKSRRNRHPTPDSELEYIDQTLQAIVRDAYEVFAPFVAMDASGLRVHIRKGPAHEEIVSLALEVRADVIIIGHHGTSGKKRAEGGIPAAVLGEAPCSVTVVRPKDLSTLSTEVECQGCVEMRASSGGAQWFCEEHQEGRVPRLRERVGNSSYTPGWGIF